jgi:hypothetical protein
MANMPIFSVFSGKKALLVAVVILTAACSGPGSGTESPAAIISTNVAAAGVPDVVAAAQAFSQSLDAAQKSDALVGLTAENAECGKRCRGGIAFADLEAGQLTLAKTLLQTALGTGDTGYSRIEDLWAADDELHVLRKSGRYGGGRYHLALLGQPSTGGTWMLHFGGHNLAMNITYEHGKVAGASPSFIGVEPTTWTAEDGTTYAPLEAMKDAVVALGSSFTPTQRERAKLGQTFGDVLLGPGADSQFPKAKQGIRVSRLSDGQKDLVMDTMKQWVGVADDTTAAATLKTYEDELDQTSIGWSGGLGMTAPGDYLRIDGPRVWIEFVCQNGVVLSSQVHYRTVWRDHARDYGGEF